MVVKRYFLGFLSFFFLLNFRVLLRIVKTLTTFLYVCNQRLRKIGECNGKSFKGYSKKKKKKKDINRSNFELDSRLSFY